MKTVPGIEAFLSGFSGRLTCQRYSSGLLMPASLAASLTLAAGQLVAAPVVVDALSMNTPPLYAQVAHFPYASPAAPKGGKLSLSANGSFDTFNGLIDRGQPADGSQYLFDSLTTASLDEPNVRYPLLAMRFRYDPANRSWIEYDLNPAARFSDGTPVRASDVVFTFNSILKQGAPALKMYYADIARVRALSPQTVRFEFRRSDNPEIALTVGETGILSERDWQGRKFDAVSLRPPLGSGPYTVLKAEPGRKIIYQRNPRYWGASLPVNRGRYNFDQIEYTYYRSSEVAFEGFKAGQYLFRQENKARTWANLYNFPAVKKGFVTKKLFYTENPVTMQVIAMNSRRPLFQDIRVRQALTLAFDFEWMNRALFNGGYERLQSYFHGSELAARGKPDAAEMQLLAPLLPGMQPAGQKAVLEPWQSPVSDGSGHNRANLLKAQSLLQQAGYHYNAAGQLLDSKNQPVTIEFLLYDQPLQRVILPYLRNLQRLGFKTSVRLVDSPQYIERLRNFDYDMTIARFPQSLSPGNEQKGYWSSEAARIPGSRNLMGVQSPVVDALVNRLLSSSSREQTVTTTRALDRVLRAGYYAIPMYGLGAERIAYWKGYEYPQRRPRYALGEDFWWVNPAEAAKTTAFLQGDKTDAGRTTASNDTTGKKVTK